MSFIVKWAALLMQFSAFKILLYGGLLSLTILFLLRYSRYRNKAKILSRIPGPKGNILFGIAFEMRNMNPREIRTYIGETICCYEDGLTLMWFMFTPYVHIYKAKAMEAILSSQIHITKNEDYDLLLPWLGTGLLTSTGSKWKTRRRMLTPTFHFKILEDFVEVINVKSRKFVTVLQKQKDGKPFDIFPLITNCTLDVILETAIGTSMDVQGEFKSDYVESVLRISEFLQNRAVNPLIRSDFMFKLLGYKKIQDNYIKILHDFSYNLIRERRAIYKKEKESVSYKETEGILGKKRRLAFLDLLVEQAEQDGNLTDEDIREEVDTFVFEGHDTTAAAVSFSIFLIGCHPEVQKKVHEELDAIFKGSDRSATAEDLKEMKYLECCIKEALRIYPSVPFFGRKLYEPHVLNGYTIPAGTNLVLNQHKLHRDPEHFPEPEKFIPERFTPEASVGRHPFAYIPFSAGPRNCIGQKFAMMEEKIVVSTVFRKLEVKSVLEPKDLQVLAQVVTRPENGIDVTIHPRNVKS